MQVVNFTSNTEKPIWRFWTRRLFLLSGFCIRDTSMLFSLLLEEHPLSCLSTFTRYCGLIQKLSVRTKVHVSSKNLPFPFLADVKSRVWQGLVKYRCYSGILPQRFPQPICPRSSRFSSDRRRLHPGSQDKGSRCPGRSRTGRNPAVSSC